LLCNVCSSFTNSTIHGIARGEDHFLDGHLDEYLKPLHNVIFEHFDGNEEVVKDRFLKMYENIIVGLPFTIFVNQNMNEQKIIEQIKLKRRYGQKQIYIHGINKENIERIKKVIKKLEKDKQFSIQKDIREDTNTIQAGIFFLDAQE